MQESSISKVLQNTTPLCFLPDGRLVCYHRGKIYVLKDGHKERSFHVLTRIKDRLFGWSRLATRLMRLGCRAAIALDNNNVVVSIGSMLYEVNLDTGEVSKGWHSGDRIRPLIFSEIKGLPGFVDGIYFGGYLVNMDKRPVAVYQRTGVDQWSVVYTFPNGAINHVHNIVADSYRNCLWIFTGDFDDSAAIWKVTDNFNRIERVAYNDQKFRGCVAYSLLQGVLYASDAPFTDNYIYLMNPETYSIQALFPLHGSCIYGCQWNDRYVFSSTVEGASDTHRRYRLLYAGNKGKGIKDDYVHLYVGDLSNSFHEIYKEKKDALSFLFQFGAFKFPHGMNNTDKLYFQPVATNKNDLRLLTYQ